MINHQNIQATTTFPEGVLFFTLSTISWQIIICHIAHDFQYDAPDGLL
jgi:hypothetical protein